MNSTRPNFRPHAGFLPDCAPTPNPAPLPLDDQKRPLRWEQVAALVVDSVSSPHSKRAYARALEDFARWAREEGQGSAFCKALVQRYRGSLEGKGLAPSSINVQLAAL